MVAGHSFGELSALCTHRVLSHRDPDYYQLKASSWRAMAATPEQGDSGTMFAVHLRREQTQLVGCIQPNSKAWALPTTATPTQLVIAGPAATVQQAAQALTEQGFRRIALPVSGTFHTAPLVAHAPKSFASAIDKASFVLQRCRFTQTQQANCSKDAKKRLRKHSNSMLQSVRFSEQIEAMYEAGARVFVGFGPKNILQSWLKTLADKNEELYAISINPSLKRRWPTLRLAAVQLCVAGVSLDNIDPYQADIAEPEHHQWTSAECNQLHQPLLLAENGSITAPGNVTEKLRLLKWKLKSRKSLEKWLKRNRWSTCGCSSSFKCTTIMLQHQAHK